MRRFVLSAALALAFGAQSASAATPVETHGALQTKGNRIVGAKHGQPVQLAGMSLYWPLWGGEKFFNKGAVDWLVSDWKCNLIRVPVGVEPAGGYISNAGAMTSLVKAAVDAAIAQGVYVIIDWHDHNAPAHTEQAKTFFREMSATYGKVPNVIWEIFNEPDKDDTWDGVKNYANQIIPIIRANSPNLIIVGTTNWSQDVDVAANSPVAGTNIAYTLHFYAGTHRASLRAKGDAALNKGFALFLTEWGTSKADGGSDGSIDLGEAKAWLDWAAARKISWANWSVVDKTESSAALKPGASGSGGWNASQFSASGAWVRGQIIALNGSSTPVDPDPVTVDTIALPGKVEAEKHSAMSGVQTETTTDAGAGGNLAYIEPGDWAEYMIKVAAAGSYRIAARVASETQGGTLAVKVDGQQAATLQVAGTGGWQTWSTTAYANLTQNLSAGVHKLRLEFGGSGTASVYNLNWVDLQPVSTGIAPRLSAAGIQARTLPGMVSIALPAGHGWTGVEVLDASGRQIAFQSVRSGDALEARLPTGGTGLRFVRLRSASGMQIVPVAAMQ